MTTALHAYIYITNEPQNKIIQRNVGTGRVTTLVANPLIAAAHNIKPYLPGGANVHAYI